MQDFHTTRFYAKLECKTKEEKYVVISQRLHSYLDSYTIKDMKWKEILEVMIKLGQSLFGEGGVTVDI